MSCNRQNQNNIFDVSNTTTDDVCCHRYGQSTRELKNSCMCCCNNNNTATPFSDYGYFWNTSVDKNPITPNQLIPFSDGLYNSPSITYDNTTREISVKNAGVYSIEFTVSAQNANQVTLFLGQNPVAGSTYGVHRGTGTNFGHTILSIPANSTISLKNYITAQASGNINLRNDPGGSPSVPPTSVNASILIIRIA